MSLKDAQKALAMVQRAKKRGRAAELTFSRTEGDEYDIETGLTGTPVTFTGLAVVLPASQGTVQAFDNRFENGTLIESTLRAVLIAAHGMTHEPRPGDQVTFPDSTTGSLIGCTPLNPDAANPIIYQGTVKL